MRTRNFIIVLGGVIILGVVFAVGALFFSGDKESGFGDSSGLTIGSNAIYVSDQEPGGSVSVFVVRLSKPGFAVVHEDGGGAPGKILGVSDLFPAGETKGPKPITLSRSTRDGETIYVMLHLDDGDGNFKAENDKPALDPVGGEAVMMIIEISGDAAEPGAIKINL